MKKQQRTYTPYLGDYYFSITLCLVFILISYVFIYYLNILNVLWIIIGIFFFFYSLFLLIFWKQMHRVYLQPILITENQIIFIDSKTKKQDVISKTDIEKTIITQIGNIVYLGIILKHPEKYIRKAFSNDNFVHANVIIKIIHFIFHSRKTGINFKDIFSKEKTTILSNTLKVSAYNFKKNGAHAQISLNDYYNAKELTTDLIRFCKEPETKKNLEILSKTGKLPKNSTYKKSINFYSYISILPLVNTLLSTYLYLARNHPENPLIKNILVSILLFLMFIFALWYFGLIFAYTGQHTPKK